MFALAGVLGSAHAADLDRTVTVDGSRIEVQFTAADFAVGLDELTAWVGRRARIVRDFYGRFPVARARVLIREVNGHGVHGGREFSAASPFIRISVGRDATRAELDDDWVLVHEMVHLALPELADRHVWLEEGLAVYVEGVARARAGNITRGEFWRGLVDDMPKGEPRAGDEGLDRTHTWGRTYWGGAIFCLQADVAIRERTGNRKGLQDALRAILAASGGDTTGWTIERVFAVGDRATGTDALTSLYRKYGDSGQPVDLDAIWRKLGIASHDGKIVFDDSAPLAAARRSITERSLP
jgi:hypothetical protein